MEQEVLRLQAGGADARRLQGLAEEQQQRLARFDREHGHLERPLGAKSWLKSHLRGLKSHSKATQKPLKRLKTPPKSY